MALIKCSECGREVSDNATRCPHCGKTMSSTNVTNPKNRRKIIIGLIGVLVLGIGIGIGIGCWILFNKNASYKNEIASTKADTIEMQTPDLALFEVTGSVKEISDIQNPVLAIILNADNSITFSREGVWNNYADMGREEGYDISIIRNEDGQLTQLSGSNLDYHWSVEYEWENGRPVVKILHGVEGGESTTIEYKDGNLEKVNTTGNEIIEKREIIYWEK